MNKDLEKTSWMEINPLVEGIYLSIQSNSFDISPLKDEEWLIWCRKSLIKAADVFEYTLCIYL